MTGQHRRGGGHARPGSRGFEAWAWLFMRVSGVVLLFLAVFHLLWMHYVIGVDNLNFQTVVSRWSNPLWRLYDFALLGFALVHGVNGLRMVLEDYLHRPGTLLAVKSVTYVLAFLLLSAGAWIIFTFHVPA
jgi:succinate dehydrogenase / fumarate reductase membrane anchor subunit